MCCFNDGILQKWTRPCYHVAIKVMIVALCCSGVVELDGSVTPKAEIVHLHMKDNNEKYILIFYNFKIKFNLNVYFIIVL